ncbi:4-hydroxy-3-methylbut-2-enyl diphosphate reductase [Alienimonas chondri]|uniref:4-hydroxy-3-methylbut-2-enyl diphosphate reductase n=1 Tax=Alienimonas chondri TaxID=2681879 RepID=A0ABX1VH72_9PLAN|nr:4-hydroxy-3-methylbut-2-enyl diphosphate reductase [Alienimonas chondri]NNJ27225.1 4-hydroxy-3-methylbut-2-enyl diphosphate reductase [Alienimonas chondri]
MQHSNALPAPDNSALQNNNERLRVVRAWAMGFCFGVRDALAATRAEREPSAVTVLGELVHNADVTGELADRGFRSLPGPGDAAAVRTAAALVTAHGASHGDLASLRGAGLRVIDTTCPLVRRVQDAAAEFAAEGRFVVVVGVPGHAEVNGVIGDLSEEQFVVVRDKSAVRCWPCNRLGVVQQSTTDPATTVAAITAVQRLNPQADVAVADTVCKPTRDRQAAVQELCETLKRQSPQFGTPTVVVVGGRNSHNTARLAALCEAEGVRAVRVVGADDLNAAAFAGSTVVGLTAGTSTPDATIDAVERRLQSFETRPPFADKLCNTDRKRDWRRWSAGEWTAYFRANGARRDDPADPWAVPWPCAPGETRPTLSAAERAAVVESIRMFQLGESGTGRFLLRCAAAHVAAGGDADYPDALREFLAEENRHAAELGRFLDAEGVPRLQRGESRAAAAFRAARHLIPASEAGLEWAIVVLLSAERVALAYYAALRQATASPTLRTLCRNVLRDEVWHLRFQSDRLATLRAGRGAVGRALSRAVEGAALFAACTVAYLAHRAVFRRAGMGWRAVRRRAGASV